MSYYDRKMSSPKPASKQVARSAEQWATKPLSGLQKAQLAIAARSAYEIQKEAGLIDLDFEQWRHEQVFIACGKAGLREAGQAHYRSIKAHFLQLSGKAEKAKNQWAKTGRVKGSEEVHDTHENREVSRAILRDLIAGSHGAISEAYVAAISRNKFEGRDIYNLTARELQQMVMTVRARLRKKQT